jgi:catechol 2,3-dioxygenase-like lactoylglutathione lyase family enzyme
MSAVPASSVPAIGKNRLRSLQARHQEAACEDPALSHKPHILAGRDGKEWEPYMKIDMKFEVAIVPVSDVDRSKAFYTKLGFRVDDDIVNGDDFRVVQLTPPGSAASVSIGKGVTDAKPGSFRGGLIVSDIVAAHKQIAASGIEATEVFHGSSFSLEARISGPDPERKSYSSYVAFQDSDGNAWIVQEVTQRAPGRALPK